VFWLLAAVLAVLGLSLALAYISTQYKDLQGWGSFLATLLLCGGILAGGWLALRVESPPRWLGALLVGAAILRLAVGTFWFVTLPVAGHGGREEQAGYVMADARERDQAAWELANSGKPLMRAFFRVPEYRKADQYGGLLVLSALVYRYLGGWTHQPLMMVGVTAAFSALAILFTWAFARRAWGRRTADIAAWILALYPEAVLLGSSQMREAVTVTFVVAAMYGLVRYADDHSWTSLAWILGALLLNLPLSPPLTALLMVVVALPALVMGRRFLFGGGPFQHWRLWLILGGVVILVSLGLYFSWQQLAPREDFDLVTLITWWIRKSAEWQAYLTRKASGWIQKIFHGTPDWMHVPLLLAYGVVQPFLPAALIAPSEAPVWQWIAIWRAAGWTLLLPFLLYAPLRAWTKKGSRGFTRGLTLAVWLIILAASYRAGGDQWDNARYRSAFAGLQVALVAWAWVEQRRISDPWIKRSLAGVALILAWFLPWYLRRYTEFTWPVVDVFKTLGLGIASAILFILWDWAKNYVKRDT
jgi:hypothetical protein